MAKRHGSHQVHIQWRKRFGTRLVCVFTLSVILILIVAGIGLIRIAESAQKKIIYRFQERNADEVATLISSYISNAIDDLVFYESIKSLAFLSSSEQLRALDDMLIRKSDVFTQLTLLNADGSETVKVSPYHTYLPDELGNQAHTEMFSKAFEGSRFIGSVFVSPDSKLLSIPVALPISAPGKRITGVLAAEVNIAPLWERVSKVRIGETGYAFLVDSTGRFIAHQEPARVLQRYGEDMTHLSPVNELVVDKSEYKHRVRQYEGLNGERVIGLRSPVEGTDWAVIVELPVREAFADLTRMKYYLAGLITVAVLITIALTSMVIRRIIRPVNALTTTATAIADGDLNQRVSIESEDEIGSLAWAFNSMTEQLQAFIAKLEQRVAERRQAEEALRTSEEKYRRLIENLREKYFFYSHDTNGVFTYISPSTVNVLGYTIKQFSTHYSEYLTGNPINRKVEYHTELSIQGTRQPPYVVELYHRDGSIRSLEVLEVPVFDENGNVTAVEGIAHDISELKRAEEELRKYRDHLEELVAQRTKELGQKALEVEEANRLKSIFLASMSHELRTPLNSIIGFTGIILQGMVGEVNKEQNKQLTMVKNSANHLLSLINELLDIAKIEAGKMEPSYEEFALDDIVSEVMESFSPAVAEKGLELKKDIPEGITLISDRRRVMQSLMNFVSNAVKFTDRGIVKVSAGIKGKNLVICVTDTGPGIKEEDMEKLFQPFLQIDPSLTNRHEGTGLGLHLTKKLAIFLGGDVSAKSKQGKGSTFTFRIPLKPVQAV